MSGAAGLTRQKNVTSQFGAMHPAINALDWQTKSMDVDLITTRRFQVIGSFLLYNRLFNKDWPKLMQEPKDPAHHHGAPRPARPYLTRLRLALGPWTVHFNSPGYIKPDTMLMLEVNVCKKTLEETRTDDKMRQELGTAFEFWDDLSALLKAAIPSLEKRCFAPPDPASQDYENLSGPLIASFSTSLLKDLERLNQVVAIARNVLTHGEKAQNLAADRAFDKEIFALINVCVRVTARGYDGETGTPEEDKWQGVINSYKKLLITCLQFLNNLVARNEQRKLMLWIELFDSHLENDMPNFADLKFLLPQQDGKPGKAEERQGELKNGNGLDTFKTPQQPASSPFLLYIGRVGPLVKKTLTQNGEKPGATEIAAECKRRWQSMSETERNEWNMLYADVIAKYRDDITSSTAYKRVVDQHAKNEESVQALAQSINQLQVGVDKMRSTVNSSGSSSKPAPETAAQNPSLEKQTSPPVLPVDKDTGVPLLPEILGPPTAKESDFRVTYAAEFGERLLLKGKNDLMKRLEGQASHVASPSSPTGEQTSHDAAPPVSSGLSDDDESEDDYDAIPGDDGRGLLTDVPLILGPTEIEVLPMIIMAGIVPPIEGQPGYNPDPSVMANVRNMHTVRCHLLLAQDNGRNLLRELLIFVAAWDLREEELYFKFMMKIMEAILANGLMPFAYHAFRESKDIISPAQAVIMKLLTNIFRTRQSQAPPRTSRSGPREFPMRVDVHMVNFLLTEFRRHIIPQTCGLIYLQGLIRAGRFHPEDFPLNLWDMERMYEGVYQYLEFFAILTENDTWKYMLADWEITSELVTLLKELDAAIPKGAIAIPPLASSRPMHTAPAPAAEHPDGTTPVLAVERPYDTSGGAPPAPEHYMPSPRPYIDEPQDEPSDFEWRNLKKLAVLVLSSLVWKNRKVQDQVRPLGGIEAVLNCCNYDEHNPYIREHAIMCLRFLLEGNQANIERVRQLEAQGTVPNEVLDQHGYETYMDSKGQVQLRRKEGARAPAAGNIPLVSSPSVTHPPSSSSSQPPAMDKGKGKADSIPRDPKDLEHLVQQVMRDLPVRVGGKGTMEREDKDKGAVAKLDRGFDGRG